MNKPIEPARVEKLLAARKHLFVLTLLAAISACSALPVTEPDSAAPIAITVIDFRQLALRSEAVLPEYSAALAVKQAVYGTGFPDTLYVRDPVAGAFTIKGESQSVFLITRTDLPNPMLAVFSTAANSGNSNEAAIGSIIGQFVLDEPYRRLLAAKDINGDGIDELILLQEDFHMGVLVQTVDVLNIADMKLKIETQEEFVLQDSCASDVNERVIRASRLRFSSDGVFRDEFVAACVEKGSDTEPEFLLLE